jgi:hypothetical protein
MALVLTNFPCELKNDAERNIKPLSIYYHGSSNIMKIRFRLFIGVPVTVILAIASLYSEIPIQGFFAVQWV